MHLVDRLRPAGARERRWGSRKELGARFQNPRRDVAPTREHRLFARVRRSHPVVSWRRSREEYRGWVRRPVVRAKREHERRDTCTGRKTAIAGWTARDSSELVRQHAVELRPERREQGGEHVMRGLVRGGVGAHPRGGHDLERIRRAIVRR